MGLLVYKKYVPVLLALAVSGTGTMTAGAAYHGGSGTAGVGVTADAGKHAGREPEQKPAADEVSQDGDRNPGGNTGSGGSTGGVAGKPGSGDGSGGGTDGSGEKPGGSVTGGSGKDSGSGPDDGVEQGRADSGGADTGKNPDSTASDSGDTAAEMPETESGENRGSEPEEGSRKNTGMLWAAFLAAAAAVLAGPAVLLKRRGRRFHGILTDQKKRGIRIVRSRNGTDVSVPVLAGRLSSGDISFQDYKDLLMRSSSVTVLPYGTKMTVSVTDGETAGTGRPEDADECRMLERLGEVADTAHSRGKTVAADVVLWHDRKDFEIRIHFVFR